MTGVLSDPIDMFSADHRAWDLACSWFSMTLAIGGQLVGVLDLDQQRLVLANDALRNLGPAVLESIEVRLVLAAQDDAAATVVPSSTITVGRPSNDRPPTDDAVSAIEVGMTPVLISDTSTRYRLVLGHTVEPRDDIASAGDAISLFRPLLNRPGDRLFLLDPAHDTMVLVTAAGAADAGDLSSVARLYATIHPDDTAGTRRFVENHSALDGISDPYSTRFRVDGGWRWGEMVMISWPDAGSASLCWLRLHDASPVSRRSAERNSELEEALRRVVNAASEALGVAPTEFTPPAPRPEMERLSARELEILPLVMRGLRPSSIAATLFLSAGTVRNHLSHIYKKFDVASHAELLDKLNVTAP
jgi:DNA-binding CsgD family transcriptional regulator